MTDLEKAAREVYKYAKIAVNQIICLGGESCQPCENRESLALALDELGRVLSSPTPAPGDLATCPACKHVAPIVQVCEKCGHQWSPSA
jgi:hypothetical protein